MNEVSNRGYIGHYVQPIKDMNPLVFFVHLLHNYCKTCAYYFQGKYFETTYGLKYNVAIHLVRQHNISGKSIKCQQGNCLKACATII